MTNYALIDFNDKVFDSPKTYLSCDELLKLFYDLYVEFKNIGKKYSLLKGDHVSFVNDLMH